ncbi:MAG TPA: tRNA pseudouridine(55) synthase TruB [Bacteroidales bacterium]|nr:tRNA pseudouridine(55) synthase TruB [Bacteroidales bacterium]HOG66214.1 tRNA pseudouridine(55) synthase TruB [Bacteroidales bacterium]HPA12875.1 tRNA pseudouridine(55) synthase TruB [Bacteroidales bacterium]HQO07904.1 tRNA pseudouridine(55) synthase TruB [Bacteroidales bacterium]HQP53906.1 tRNA pseudouridine(55) synthase TruB [Bacteroidales bacterium]
MISKLSLTIIPNFEEGEVLLINKELDWTSFDVVNSIKAFLKYELGIKKIKIGHAGTLDPKATGLMIICTGKQTKSIEKYQSLDKEYTGSFTLGQTTPSWDTETTPNQNFPIDHITEKMIYDITNRFIGTIWQRPPSYSAIWIDGRRAYKIARKDNKFKLEPRQVEISEFEIVSVKIPQVNFRIRCSKGTYIRALANDFGKALNSGAYLSSLCRSAIGHFKLEEALSINEFKERYKNPEEEW